MTPNALSVLRNWLASLVWPRSSAKADKIPGGGSVRDLFALFKWAKGRAVSESGRIDGNNVKVINCDGDVNTYNQCTFHLYQASSVRRDVDELTRPLDHAGVDSISLSSGDDETNVEFSNALKLEKRDREFFQRKESGVLRDAEQTVTLEVVTANLRGESSGWRFYYGEVEFNAAVTDEVFLELVRAGQKVFKTGDMIESIMRVVQRRPSTRLVTERSIVQVLTSIPATT